MKYILLVEDDKLFRDYIKEQLINGLQGIKILEASNAFEAIDVFNDKEVDLILSELVLPSVNALSMLLEIMSNYETLNKIPVIFLSDNDLDEEQKHLEKYGVRKVINKKTTSPKEIVESVGKLLCEQKS